MAEETLFCLRVRYVQTGRLRYLSHLELLRAIERCVRRARLPYAVTQGFSPRMKAAYGPALPVGVGSFDEWFDVWLKQYVPADQLLLALQEAAPVDLMPQEAAYTQVHGDSLSASLTISQWLAHLRVHPAHAGSLGCEEVRQACEAVIAAGEVEHVKSGKVKKIQLDGKLVGVPSVEPDSECDGGVTLGFTTRSSNAGALRPDAFVGAVVARLSVKSAVCGSNGDAERLAVVSSEVRVRARIDRTNQFIEEGDATWRRPI